MIIGGWVESRYWGHTSTVGCIMYISYKTNYSVSYEVSLLLKRNENLKAEANTVF